MRRTDLFAQSTVLGCFLLLCRAASGQPAMTVSHPTGFAVSTPQTQAAAALPLTPVVPTAMPLRSRPLTGNTLTPNQFLQNQVVPIFAEADFLWRALQFTSTSTFAVRFIDGQGYYLSDGLIWSTNLPNTAGDPFPVFPEVPYPAAGRIQLEIQDLSSANNTVQLLFIGANRYPVIIPASLPANYGANFGQ